MLRIGRFIVWRFLFAVPQIFAITLVTFFLVRLLPGNPAYQLAGVYATPEVVRSIQEQLGLDKPIHVQYLIYLGNLTKGNLGESWFTSHSVAQELAGRFPATLELISATTLVMVVAGVGIGAVTGMRQNRIANAIVRTYGHLAGAFPDFWLGLALAFLFFFILPLAPAPVGQLAIALQPPRRITGMYVVDALITGNWPVFWSALSHLVLPTLALAVVYTAPVIKLTKSTIQETMNSDFIRYARACGLPSMVIFRYALRNSLPPSVAMIGITYGFLLGGAVLIENVYSWGGLGSFVVEAVQHSDYFVVQAFVLVAALFNLVVYLAVDLIYIWIDPRTEF